MLRKKSLRWGNVKCNRRFKIRDATIQQLSKYWRISNSSSKAIRSNNKSLLKAHNIPKHNLLNQLINLLQHQQQHSTLKHNKLMTNFTLIASQKLPPSIVFRIASTFILFNFNDYHDQIIKNWQKRKIMLQSSKHSAKQKLGKKKEIGKSFVIKKYSFWIIKSCARDTSSKENEKTARKRRRNSSSKQNSWQHQRESVASRNSFKFRPSLPLP